MKSNNSSSYTYKQSSVYRVTSRLRRWRSWGVIEGQQASLKYKVIVNMKHSNLPSSHTPSSLRHNPSTATFFTKIYSPDPFAILRGPSYAAKWPPLYQRFSYTTDLIVLACFEGGMVISCLQILHISVSTTYFSVLVTFKVYCHTCGK